MQYSQSVKITQVLEWSSDKHWYNIDDDKGCEMVADYKKKYQYTLCLIEYRWSFKISLMPKIRGQELNKYLAMKSATFAIKRPSFKIIENTDLVELEKKKIYNLLVMHVMV